MRVFVLEDDGALLQGISLKLTKEGHEVQGAESVMKAEECISRGFDMAILDINLPDGSGLDICQKMRSVSPQIYILLLTANDMETDIVMGYDMGADDYMTKPFSLSVLLSKINAVQRRLEEKSPDFPLPFNPVEHTVIIDGEKISLTKNETRLLDKFLQNISQVLTKEQLIQCIWGIDGAFVDENALAVNIQRLRGKIGQKAGIQIENIRGVGYRMMGEFQ